MLANRAGWHLLGRVGCKKALLRNTNPRIYGDIGCIWADEEDEK
jgi:hypothetical protein